MKQATTTLEIPTRGKGLYEFTREAARWVSSQNCTTGLLTVFVRHTSASLVIQENADPDVLHDLNAFFSRLAPEDFHLYRHTIEGEDDMPAHIRAALTQTQLAIPLVNGHLALGAWQGLYLFEHRNMSHRRSVALHLIGE
jgi:secondary thiamine-phosphate synthase enzyme